MAVTSVQHVTRAASEGLSAKFSDLCDPHDLTSVRASKRSISKLAAKSRASGKAMRQLRSRERRVSAATPSSAADEDAFLMSYVPLKTEPALFNVRRSFRMPQAGSQLPALAHLASPARTSHGVTKRLLKLCRGVKRNKYTPLMEEFISRFFRTPSPSKGHSELAKMRAGHGLRSRTRDLFSGAFRTRGASLATYLRNFKLGEYVDIEVNGAIHKGMPHKSHDGRTGIFWDVTKRAVGVVMNKQVGNRIIQKRIRVRNDGGDGYCCRV